MVFCTVMTDACLRDEISIPTSANGFHASIHDIVAPQLLQSSDWDCALEGCDGSGHLYSLAIMLMGKGGSVSRGSRCERSSGDGKRPTI